MTLSRDQILAAEATLPTETVEVPEWGGSVVVQGLSASDADAFLSGTVKRRGNASEFDRRNFQAKLVALCLVDEQGQKLFTAADAEALGKKSATAMSRVSAVAMRLSGLGAGDVEGAEGN